MRTTFHAFMPNGLDGDPVVWIDVPDEGHAVLLDLGDLARIPNRNLLRVARAFVTHTHMDHFIGFDRLLRLALRRVKELVICGPPGFLAHVEGKVAAYTWNLIENYPLRLVAQELDGQTLRSVAYSGEGRMRPERLADRAFNGTVHAERAYTVHADVLDHGIPVLGLVLRETEHLSVDKDRLTQLGLEPGPWLRDLKQSVRRCMPGDETIEVPVGGGSRTLRRGELEREILFRTPGQRIGYVTDVRYTAENRGKVLALATGVDLLVCEAAFLDEDRDLAAERNHLTARQAGELAEAAGAKRLAPFHFSPRYAGREQQLLDEAASVFRGEVVRLPTGPFPDEPTAC